MRINKLLLQTGVGAAFGFALAIAASPTLRAPGGGASRREGAKANRERVRSSAGARAETPADIPAGGWMELLQRTWGEIGRDRVLAVAAGVTFYGLLALFPALSAIVALYGLIADAGQIAEHLALLSGFLPAGAIDVIREQITRIAGAGEQQLGLALAASLLLALWSANAGMKAVFDALNVAYGEEERRGFVKLNLVSLAFTGGALLFVIGALAGVAVVPTLLETLPFGAVFETAVSVGRWPVMIGLLLLFLSVLYRYGPSRDAARWSWITPGAVAASVVWLIASALFSWYLANFEDYNKTYGTLGALIALLMWMWLSLTIILAGAELNSEAERQTDRDTTEGAPAPIGLRGADAADRKA